MLTALHNYVHEDREGYGKYTGTMSGHLSTNHNPGNPEITTRLQS